MRIRLLEVLRKEKAAPLPLRAACWRQASAPARLSASNPAPAPSAAGPAALPCSCLGLHQVHLLLQVLPGPVRLPLQRWLLPVTARLQGPRQQAWLPEMQREHL